MRTKGKKNRCDECNAVMRCRICSERICRPSEHTRSHVQRPELERQRNKPPTYVSFVYNQALPDGSVVQCITPGHYITSLGRFCRDCGPQFETTTQEPPRRKRGLLF